MLIYAGTASAQIDRRKIPRSPRFHSHAFTSRGFRLHNSGYRAAVESGIDSKDGTASEALTQGIRTGNEANVKLQLNGGAPVNPLQFRVWSPLGEAAHWRKLDIMKTLLTAGAKVDALGR